MKARPLLTPQEEASRRTRHKRDQRRRKVERMEGRIEELSSEAAKERRRFAIVESRFLRTLSAAAAALERVEVADDPSGAADEAAAILRQVVQLDGTYVQGSDEDVRSSRA